MSETMKRKRHKGIDAHGCINGVWLCAVCCIEELTPDTPQVTFPDGCAADPIKTFEGYPGIQVDAPQVRRYAAIIEGEGAGIERASMVLAPRSGEYVRYTDYASLLAEKARLEGENARLKDAIVDAGDGIYCPKCGSCGIGDCCEPRMCKFAQAYADEFKELNDDSEQLFLRAEAAEASLASLRDDYQRMLALCEDHQPDRWEGDGTCVLCEAVREHLELRTLRDAVRAWKDAEDACPPWVGGAERATLVHAREALRALVDPQGAKDA